MWRGVVHPLRFLKVICLSTQRTQISLVSSFGCKVAETPLCGVKIMEMGQIEGRYHANPWLRVSVSTEDIIILGAWISQELRVFSSSRSFPITMRQPREQLFPKHTAQTLVCFYRNAAFSSHPDCIMLTSVFPFICCCGLCLGFHFLTSLMFLPVIPLFIQQVFIMQLVMCWLSSKCWRFSQQANPSGLMGFVFMGTIRNEWMNTLYVMLYRNVEQGREAELCGVNVSLNRMTRSSPHWEGGTWTEMWRQRIVSVCVCVCV